MSTSLPSALRNTALTFLLGFGLVACDSASDISTPITAAAPTIAESGAMGDIVAASNPAGAADDDGLLLRGNLNRIRFAVDLEMNYEDETGNDAPEGASIQTIKVSDDRQVVFATVDRGNSKG
ncbi:MAG: hypothetical protein AAF809_13875, partial [Bacteroidota bacterium]